MAYGVILNHLEVDKITWGSFSKKNFFRAPLRVALMAFSAGKRGGHPFLTGVENTGLWHPGRRNRPLGRYDLQYDNGKCIISFARTPTK
jgi:hypothetical protein